jgi:hypothetical protein
VIGIRRLSAHVVAVATLAGGALVLPAAGSAASSPGATAGPGGAGLTSGSSTTIPVPPVQDGDVSVSTSGDGISLQANESALLRNGLTFSGTASPSSAGQTIEIERLGHETDWQWAPTVAAIVAPGGAFSAVWQTNHIGRFAIRAVAVSSAFPQAQQASATAPMDVTVYRPSLATQYGPGFYGRRTACGTTLTTAMIGVASRTLQCGESVALYYHGRTMVVPVIDRGPYANGADWDLTEATGAALGITGTAEIGAVSLPLP